MLGHVIMGGVKVGSCMEKGNLKIITVLIVLGISLGLLLGGQKYYNNRYVEGPVKHQLEQLSFVKSVQESKENDIYDYKIQIKRAGNVKYEYEKIDEIIASHMKEKSYQFTLQDQRSPKLEEDLHQLELSVYEAMAKNNYLWLDETFRQVAAKNGFSYKLSIDDQRLYIQIVDQDAFLYEIIERSTPPTGDINKGE